MLTILHFFINKQEFVTNANSIDSIVKFTNEVSLTKLPEYGDNATVGVYKYHDKIYQINDAAVMLNCPSDKPRSFMLLFDNGQGLLVDAVSKVDTIEEHELSQSPIVSRHVKRVYIYGDSVIPMIDF